MIIIQKIIKIIKLLKPSNIILISIFTSFYLLYLLIIEGPRLIILTKGIDPKEFTIALIPDTQKYTLSQKNMKVLDSKISWILKNTKKERIVLITHVGDIIHARPENKSEKESQNGFTLKEEYITMRWKRANKSLSRLINSSDIPVSIIIGNHDYDILNNKSLNSNFEKYFSSHKYKNKDWFLANGSKQKNTVQRFTFLGQDFIHIGMEWLPSDKAIEFAENIIRRNPKIPVIITTHSYLNKGYPAKRINKIASIDFNNSHKYNSPEQLYRKLIEPNPQVFLVLSGHNYGNGRLVSNTLLDQKVVQIMANYQSDPHGGNGWIQLIRVNTEGRGMKVINYSPTYKPLVTGGPNRFLHDEGNYKIKYNLENHIKFIINHQIEHFRQGEKKGDHIYNGVLDNSIVRRISLNKMSHDYIKDKSDVYKSNKNYFSLIKYKDVFGNESGQIKSNSIIVKAILTLTFKGNTIKKNDIRLQVFNDNYSKIINKKLKSNSSKPSLYFEDNNIVNYDSTISFDVTESLQMRNKDKKDISWLLSTKTEYPLILRSSDSISITDRPMLTIVTKKNENIVKIID